MQPRSKPQLSYIDGEFQNKGTTKPYQNPAGIAYRVGKQ